jgi:hypothetical protein
VHACHLDQSPIFVDQPGVLLVSKWSSGAFAIRDAISLSDHNSVKLVTRNYLNNSKSMEIWNKLPK